MAQNKLPIHSTELAGGAQFEFSRHLVRTCILAGANHVARYHGEPIKKTMSALRRVLKFLLGAFAVVAVVGDVLCGMLLDGGRKMVQARPWREVAFS